MTPQTFIAKWGPGGPAFQLNEEQGAQSRNGLASSPGRHQTAPRHPLENM